MHLENQDYSLEETREPNYLDGFRVIHLHPTLRCNLKCKHCYSSSAPNLKDGINHQQIVDFLDYAATYGFNALSVSGGEPFLYKELTFVLANSQKLGYKNSVASNGMLLQSERSTELLHYIDLMAISIDGDQTLHNQIRASKYAYAKMLEGVELLQQKKKNFGFIHTITPQSWEMLIPLADLAFEKKAKLIQFHPLEFTGRARLEMVNGTMNQTLLHKVFIIINYLKSKYRNQLNIQLDFLHRDYIKKHPETIAYFGANYQPNIHELSKALKTIIVDEVGDVYPISYGFSKQFLIGNISEIGAGINIFKRFLKHWKRLYAVIAATHHEIVNDQDNDLAIWTELIVKNSQRKVQF